MKKSELNQLIENKVKQILKESNDEIIGDFTFRKIHSEGFKESYQVFDNKTDRMIASVVMAKNDNFYVIIPTSPTQNAVKRKTFNDVKNDFLKLK